MALVSRRRGLVVTLALAIAVGASFSIAAAARTNGWRDDFTTLDASRWLVSSRPFGHGTLYPANVTAAGGQLRIELPANTLDGGEMRTKTLYRFGTYRARMKLANAPSSLTAFFLYKAPDYEQELDIELYNDSSRRVMFSTYSGGRQTHTQTLLLPFDATADYHDYTIQYGGRTVQFLVDGVPMQSWSNGVTNSAMYVFLNAWFPSWLAGQAPSTDQFTSVDWVDYSPS